MSSSDSNEYTDEDEDVEELSETRMYKIFAAVIQNKVRPLQRLLTSPKWHGIRDDGHLNLLEMAILLENKRVFDFLISIPGFPLDILDSEQPDDAVVISLYNNPHFLHEMVRKGANIDKLWFQGKTALHNAFLAFDATLAHHLIDRGVDVNACASSPLSPLQEAYNMICQPASVEIIPHLLMAGAKPEIRIFEQSVLNDSPSEIREALFYYIFDCYSEVTVKLYVVLKLACQDPDMFYEIMKCPIKVVVCYHISFYFEAMLLMSTDCLLLVLQNFAKLMSAAFVSENETVSSFPSVEFLPLENIEMILDSPLKPFMISAISSLLDINKVISCSVESEVANLYCYLLSYGLNLQEIDVQEVYKRFDYCELFKLFLHMDFKIERLSADYQRSVMPFFVYWPSMDVDVFLDATHIFCDFEKLWPFFGDERLTEIYCENESRELKREDPPPVPRLVDLARNQCRKFIITKYGIQTSKDFVIAIHGLSPGLKKILMYETELY